MLVVADAVVADAVVADAGGVVVVVVLVVGVIERAAVTARLFCFGVAPKSPATATVIVRRPGKTNWCVLRESHLLYLGRGGVEAGVMKPLDSGSRTGGIMVLGRERGAGFPPPLFRTD